MRKLSTLLLLLLAIGATLGSCNKHETYADQKKRENAAISTYIFDHKVNVISEDQFEQQGYTTNLDKNEFVLFESSGVYMQIVRPGCGEKLKSGETATVLCRFDEYNLLTDSLILSNNNLTFSSIVDKISVTNNYGTFTGSFEEGSLMKYAYSSSSVPSGWLLPLGYIKLGRQSTPEEEIAKVRIIVPHTQGQYNASMNVYPCLYDLTYQRGR